MSTCPTEAELRALLESEADDLPTRARWAHVEGCESCAQRVEHLDRGASESVRGHLGRTLAGKDGPPRPKPAAGAAKRPSAPKAPAAKAAPAKAPPAKAARPAPKREKGGGGNTGLRTRMIRKDRRRDTVALLGAVFGLGLMVAAWMFVGAAPVELPVIAPVAPRADLTPVIVEAVPPEIARQLELDRRLVELESIPTPDDAALGPTMTRWRVFQRDADGTPYAALALPRIAALEVLVEKRVDDLGSRIGNAKWMYDWDLADKYLAEFRANGLELNADQRRRLDHYAAETAEERAHHQRCTYRVGLRTDEGNQRLHLFGGMQVLGANRVGTNPSGAFLVFGDPGASRMTLGFRVPASAKAFLNFRHLETTHHALRFARLTIKLNGKTLATGIAPVRGERHYIEITPWIRPDQNELELSLDADSLTAAWLNQLEIADQP